MLIGTPRDRVFAAIVILKMTKSNMYDLEWSKKHGTAATSEQIENLELLFDVKIPEKIKQLWCTSDLSFAPTRNGDPASVIVGIDPQSNEFFVSGYFSGFDQPTSDKIHPTVSHLNSLYERNIGLVVPFAFGLDDNLFLNYENDSANTNPSIWNSYAEGDNFEECWSIVATDFDSILKNLKLKQKPEVWEFQCKNSKKKGSRRYKQESTRRDTWTVAVRRDVEARKRVKKIPKQLL